MTRVPLRDSFNFLSQEICAKKGSLQHTRQRSDEKKIQEGKMIVFSTFFVVVTNTMECVIIGAD